MRRTALVHLPHPAMPGASLCGDLTTLESCPECIRLLRALFLVHVRSVRRPQRSFCGRIVRRDAYAPEVKEALPLFSVTPEQAREMIRSRPRAPEVSSGSAYPSGLPPLCSGCETNLARFDEANLRAPARPTSPSGRPARLREPSLDDGNDGERP